MKKIKIKIDKETYGIINIDILKKEFDIVDSNNVDFCISVNNILTDTDGAHILLVMEPPLADYAKILYSISGFCHSVFIFNPHTDNEFPITTNPIVYPYPPFYIEKDIIRKDTTITNRHIYYAGQKGEFLINSRDEYDSINLYGLRSEICEYLKKNYPETTIVGKGWNKETKTPEIDWHFQKMIDISECKADFVLCLENSIMKNYLTEKIHDGFSSDRVVLYLGNPDIDKYVPEDCFINLNDLFNKETKEFDFELLLEIITNMSQNYYDDIIKNARKWRKTLRGGFEKERDRVTKLIIERIKE